MQTDEIIREILKSISFRNTDIESDSHYLLNTNRRGRPIQIRVSNHGTYLRTWVDLANGKDSQMRLVDPSISINISIVFVDAGNNLTKDCIDPNCDNCAQAICKPSIVKGITSKNRQYSVLQYTYQSEMINNRYLKSIINAINRASIGGRYIDPLNSLQLKRAKVKSMTSHDILTEENNNINLQFKMKQRIRLTEGDLHRIIRNCIKEASGYTRSPEQLEKDRRIQAEADAEYAERNRRSDEFDRNYRQWRTYGDWNWDNIGECIAIGYYCADKFESGEWLIRSYLADLDRIANG